MPRPGMRPSADTLLVWTGAPCSYGCGACPIDPRNAIAGAEPGSLQIALARLSAHDERLVVLLGGEPLLRRDLFRLIATIRAAGGRPGLITTGRPLAYAQLRYKLRRGGLAYLRMQFFGTGDTHDRATAVPGAYEHALGGLRAWIAESDAECDVDVALSTRGRPIETVIAEARVLAEHIASSNVQIVIAVDPTSRAADDPTLHQSLAGCVGWNHDATRPLLAWEGLPDVALPAGVLSIPSLRPQFLTPAPRACCLGPIDALVDAAAAQPRATRANSFNFVRSTTVVPWTPTADVCTAHQAAGGRDPYRHLWLVEDDRLVLYSTDTGDFDRSEVERVKDEWSHLFVDRAPAGVLDDFVEGMRRVAPDAICDSCTHRADCGRRFRVVEGAPYAREEARIAQHIAGLRGRVLDVGCGEQLYQDVLAPLVRSGTVSYTGLDPDEHSLTRLRAVLPEGRFHLGGIEDFHGQLASYDAILCLRSLNHVVDLDEALARMASLLKPGGSLLIVECTPFAMLRHAEQVAAADRAPRAGHQHFRNVASEEVLPLAHRRSLRVVEHQPAARDTTNEWILVLQRPGPIAP